MIQSALARVTPASRVRYAVTGIAATGLAIAAAIAMAGGASAADPLQVKVGAGEGTVQAQAYLPGAFSVAVGDSVTFTITSDEPHSVTFGVGPEGEAPDTWPVTGWAPPPEAPPGTPADLGEAQVDGTTFVNTGLLWKGSTATAVFTSPGTYGFICVIHPGMAGQVDGPRGRFRGHHAGRRGCGRGRLGGGAPEPDRGGPCGPPGQRRGPRQPRRHQDLEHLRRCLHGAGGAARGRHRLPRAVRDDTGRPCRSAWVTRSTGRPTAPTPSRSRPRARTRRPSTRSGPPRAAATYDGTSFYHVRAAERRSRRTELLHAHLPGRGHVPVHLRAAPVPWPARRHRRRPAAAERSSRTGARGIRQPGGLRPGAGSAPPDRAIHDWPAAMPASPRTLAR